MTVPSAQHKSKLKGQGHSIYITDSFGHFCLSLDLLLHCHSHYSLSSRDGVGHKSSVQHGMFVVASTVQIHCHYTALCPVLQCHESESGMGLDVSQGSRMLILVLIRIMSHVSCLT